MTGLYMTGMVNALRAAGLIVKENSITEGWEHRARSSGGFPLMPLGVQWHHTASSTSPENDLSYMIDGSDDAPIGNLYLDRNGFYWPIAAGASNTAGKGGPLTLSRGTIPMDQANTQSIAIEVANNGVGEPWPVGQINAFFAGSNALNAMCGNKASDLFTHALGGGGSTGWTSRKIDPATAAAVQGPWRPRSTNSSGTWNQDDIRAEALRRATAPAPIPPTPPDPVPPPNDPPLPPIILEDQVQIMQQGTRVLDTRQSGFHKLAANETINVDLKATEPVLAAMVNITAVAPEANGFLTVWGQGVRPETSCLNTTTGENVSNAVIAPTEGDVIHVYTSVPTHLLVDVQAFWP